MTEQIKFSEMVTRAIGSTGLAGMRTVIEKELLHYDILFCLDNADLLKNLTFQGGTSLRLCYGGNRFSEDLDFAGGVDFTGVQLANMKNCIEDYLGNRYGLQVSVKEPDELRQEPGYEEIRIDKWQVSVTTAPEQKDMPRQGIKIEVANIPAYTSMPNTLKRNYDVLPDGYSDTLIMCETLDEIMCDKLISFVATTKYVRNRDIWDLPWLHQQNAAYNPELVRRKIQDYRIPNYEELLTKRLATLEQVVTDGKFDNEMRRFLPQEVYNRTLGRAEFSNYLVQTLRTLLTAVQRDLAEGNNQVGFIM